MWHRINIWFQKAAVHTADAIGSAAAFMIAMMIITVWATSGPIFKFSDTWQLVINTGTTIVTFLVVFLLQNTQNRDARAIHLKLDELIRTQQGARNKMVTLEDLTDEDMSRLRDDFRKMADSVRTGDAQTAILPPEGDDAVRHG